jgi:hypothetical protein
MIALQSVVPGAHVMCYQNAPQHAAGSSRLHEVMLLFSSCAECFLLPQQAVALLSKGGDVQCCNAYNRLN